MKSVIVILFLGLSAHAQLKDKLMIQGQILRFDRNEVIMKRVNGAMASIPRAALPKEFKLESGAAIQKVPVQTSFFSKIKIKAPQVLRWPAEEARISAKKTFQSLQRSVSRSGGRKN